MDNVNKMPPSWIQTTLGDISLINPKLDFVNLSDDLEISFIPMAAVETESGKVDLTQTRKLGSVKKGYTPFIDGDVIFAKITPCMENGKIAFLNGLKEGIGFGSTEFHVSRPLNNISRKLIFYFLVQRSYRKDAQSNMTGSAGQLRVPTNFFRDSRIPLPPLLEQHRIVAKIEELFSELDKGVEALKTAQQQLKVYRQAVLKWAFEGKLTEEWRTQQKDLYSAEVLLKQIRYGKEKSSDARGKKIKSLTPITKEEMAKLPILPKEWCWVKLGDHAFVTKLAGFEFTKYVKYKDEGDIPVIRAQNVSKDRFVPRNFLYVDREIMENLPRSRVHGGEILMVFVGAGLGNVGIVPEKQEYFLGPNVAKIALEIQFLNKYTFHFLCSLLGFANVTGMTKATAQGSISMGNIREVSVPLISLEEQQQIVAEIETRLSMADKLEETISQSLQQAEALRQSILKKAFAGQLVPQDPNDEPASKLLERIKAEKAAQPPVKKKIDQMKKDRLRAEYKSSDFPDGLVRGKYSEDI